MSTILKTIKPNRCFLPASKYTISFTDSNETTKISMTNEQTTEAIHNTLNPILRKKKKKEEKRRNRKKTNEKNKKSKIKKKNTTREKRENTTKKNQKKRIST